MWAKADPSAGEMSEGTGETGEECSGKARMQGARLRTCLDAGSEQVSVGLRSLFYLNFFASTDKGPPIAAAL